MFERRLDPLRTLPGPEAPDPLAALLPRRDPARATRLLGVLNLTPDSFHDGGTDPTALASVERARVLAARANAVNKPTVPPIVLPTVPPVISVPTATAAG